MIWCDKGWQPICYGFCPNERSWKREMRKLKHEGETYPTTDASCNVMYQDAGSPIKPCIIVTINDRFDTFRDPITVMGLICHEAVHVFDYICRFIGEEKPSDELKCYAIQAITQNIADAYHDTRKPLSLVKRDAAS